MTGPTFHYGESACPDELKPWLWNYWEFRAEGDGPGAVTHHVPPDGCTSIALVVHEGQLRHAAASGPWLEPLVVPILPNRRYWGVRCRPEGGCLLLGVPPERLRNRNQPLEGLAPLFAARLGNGFGGVTSFDQAVGVMNQVFGAWLHRVGPPDAIACAAVNRLVGSRGEATIAPLAGELAIAPRTLLRRFRAATGLSPKQFARICRFRFAALQLTGANPPTWAEMASGTGFADQAHMIHEFKDLTGLTPEALGDRIRKTSHGDLVI